MKQDRPPGRSFSCLYVLHKIRHRYPTCQLVTVMLESASPHVAAAARRQRITKC
ncbi:hypothetical protein CSUI_009227 [Cystoisospora suis]|uniref:Uncharacterized protein n=1 Tax=Cystoisospora suis TaxID=483139 RepID=A0A2C6KKK6_9APIC|nr:hypothetical protein CSUI_009227 [Cystoisospora suis]